MSEELSRVEDLLENGVEEPVLPMSELEAILRGEKIKPHSRVAELLLQYNPQDILIEKSITENGTYYASADNAAGYFKVIVDTPVIPPVVLDHLVETITQNGTYNYNPEHDGYSDAEITVNVPTPQPVVASKTITENDTYVAADEQLDGYSQVVVNVPPTPMDTMNITHNGTYRPPTGRGFNEVNVTVPLGSKSITENGTYTATDDNLDGYSSVAVDVPQIGIKDIPNTPTPIASFNDGTSNPLKSLTASIVPVQDLHGYDSPWAGGAGKNKVDDTSIGQIFRLVTPIEPNTTITASVKAASGTDTIQIRFYDQNNNHIDYWSLYQQSGDRYYRTVTDIQQTVYGISFNANGSISDCQVELSNSMTSYAPYSNICPISGWTEEVVTRCGKNQAKKTIHGYINYQNSKIVIDNDSESVVFYAVAGKTYTVSSSVTMNRSMLGLADTDNITNQYQLLDIIELSNEVVTWTATWTGWTVWYKCTSAQSGFANSVQVEFGSTATTYEPYAGTTYTIPFTDSQGNPVEVYGGSVDVVNGDGTDILGYVNLGTLRWIKNSGRFEAQLPDNSQTYVYNSDLSDLMSEMWTPKVRDAGWNNMTDGQYGIAERQLRIKYSSVETTEEFATLVNGSIFLYPLATPTTFYTQPTSIKSLDGENNVSASTGEILSGKYFGYVYPELGTKTITENGTYVATDDNLDGYSQVTIDVAGGGGETKYYEYIRALNGQIIVRVEYPDAERTYASKTLWFFNGFYTDGGDKPIPANLFPYLPVGWTTDVMMTSGYSDNTSETQIGWVGFLYPNRRDPEYTKFRTWTENKGSTLAGTFWGVLDISGSEEQITEWFDPYENVPPSQIKNYGGTIIDGYNLNTNLKALGIVLKDDAMSYTIDNDSFDIIWNQMGAYIGFSYCGDVDLKASDIQRISYKINFGTCYDNANNQNIRPFVIGVTDTIRTTPSTGIYFDPSQVDNYFTKYKMYYKDVCNTTVEDYVDVSDIEGPCYLFIVATGWVASITDLSMVSNSTPQIGTTLSQFNFFNYVSEDSNANKIIPIDTESFDVYWSGAIYIGHCLTGAIPLSGKKRLDIDMDYIGENYQHSSGTHTRNHNLAIVVTDTKVDSYVNLDNLERDNHIIAIKEWDGNDIYGQSIHTSIDLSNISGEYYINYQLPGFNIDGFKVRLYSNS